MRAKFLELAAQYTGRGEMADKLCMLGLFSLLEAMLETSFADVFSELQLDGDVQGALLDGAGPRKNWLSLARLMDTGNWLALDSLAAKLGLSMKDVSRCRTEVFDWAKEAWVCLRLGAAILRWIRPMIPQDRHWTRGTSTSSMTACGRWAWRAADAGNALAGSRQACGRPGNG
ncbi:MAG: hypothetical protein ACOCVM_08740 [Desulfovibrionaceae bacterium]